MGFLGGFADDASTTLDATTADERARLITDHLVQFFGPECARPVGYVEQDWRAEPYLSGCVPAAAPGVLSAAGTHVSAPWGRIHWAGAESSDVWEGHMEGAVHAAQRAAAEVLSSN